MHCRRCYSNRLVKLVKKSSQDNDVFRCQECSFLFSPSTQLRTGPSTQAEADPSSPPQADSSQAGFTRVATSADWRGGQGRDR